VPVETANLLPERYRDPRRIARGGMGDVYRATDSTLGREVAVKVLGERYAADEGVRRRFTREALAAARLSGTPNVITIFDVGEHEGRPYIVMEYLAGGSLESILRREGPQPPERALGLLDEAARGLDAAHAAGIVHRDVKPANLLLDGEGRVHVADFGIASAAGFDSMTATGTILGTAGYLSPEQARGERAGPASDRYGLGVVAFELVTGHRPFESESITAEAAAHVNAPVPSVCERREELPCELDPVFRRALAKDPGARYGSAAELVAELRAALEAAAGRTAVLAPTAPTHAVPPPAPPSRRRLPGWAPLAALLAAAGIAGAVAAALLTGGGDGGTTAGAPQPKVVTRVRNSTTTVVRTTTPPPSTTATAPAAPASGGDPHGLNDRGYELMRSGDYASALPLLRQAVAGLQGKGPGDPYEAYANYNLGYTLLKLGQCSEAVPYLETAKRLEPSRPEPKDALKQARGC
jgi:eukaryotic-like serine/threonine-protein kinase